jgi:UDP-glucose 4-epimerase
VGTGIETDVNRLYRVLADAAGVADAPRHGPEKPGEQRRSCIDPSAAGPALGWRPEVGIEDGLRRTLEWFRARR